MAGVKEVKSAKGHHGFKIFGSFSVHAGSFRLGRYFVGHEDININQSRKNEKGNCDKKNLDRFVIVFAFKAC